MNNRLILFVILVLNVGGIVFNTWQNGFYNWLNTFLVFNWVLMSIIQIRKTYQLNELSNLTTQNGHAGEPISKIKNHLVKTKSLLEEIQLAIAGINEIGNKAFSAVVQSIQDESTRNMLLSAHEAIMKLREKEIENNWITQGLAKIAELKHKGNDIADFSFQAISTIVKYINANQGGFFLLKGEGNNAHFELAATYAYGKQTFIEKRIDLGEGLIGQTFYEKELIYLEEVPKNYVKIASGLGEALPRSVCIVPLLFEGKMLGAIEIASFNKIRPAEIQYLKEIAENLGYNLNSIENHRRTEILLEESQKMAQEVKDQEEELRKNMVKLQAAQEQMRRKQSEIDAVLSSISTVELNLEGDVIEANPIFLGITGYTLTDIQGKPYKVLIPQSVNDSIQYKMIWDSVTSGRSFSGEFRIANKAQKDMWMAGNFIPLLSENGQPYKIMVMSFFTTQDKEKLIELQELVTAIKNCFPIAEINQDMTFKTANDLFLSELGIRRLELKQTLPKNILANGSYAKFEQFLDDRHDQPNSVILSISDKSGMTKKFNTTLIKIGSSNNQHRKGLMILRNPV